MGGNISMFKSQDTIKKEAIIELFDKVDSIAADYITSENFTDMHNLLEDKYCSKLIILTTDILEKKLKPYEISYLKRRIDMGKNAVDKMVSENIVHFNKTMIDELDVEDKEKKADMCKGIAKFYIKLAHVYGAIVSSMNPVYEYVDDDGETKRVDFKNRSKLLDEKIITKVSELSNFCSDRVFSLSSEIIKTSDEQFKVIKPDICEINKKEVPDEKGNTKTVIDMPGFQELEKLYMDEYIDGKYTMSERSKKRYLKDVRELNTAINGYNYDKLPESENIKSFSDIELNKFHETPECKSNGFNEVKIDETSSSFKEYGDLIRNMIKTSQESQVSLLEQIKQLFKFEKKDGEVKAVLQDDLNQYRLDKISKNCRDIIIKMYIECEKDFIKGLQIYNAIREELIMDKYDEINRDDDDIIEIEDFKKTLETIEDNDKDNNPNYSKKSIENIRDLINSDDSLFLDLFKDKNKYDDPELVRLKEEIKAKLKEVDEKGPDENNKNNELNEKIYELTKLMYNKDKEYTANTQNEDDDVSNLSSIPGADTTLENKKNDVEKMLKYLEYIKKILPLLKDLKKTS